MVPGTELDKVPGNHAQHHLFCLVGMGWVHDCEARLLDQKVCKCQARHGGILHLEKFQEKLTPEGLLHQTEVSRNSLGGALHKNSLPLYGLLQALISSM